MARKISITGPPATFCSGTIVNYPISFDGGEIANLMIQEVASGDRWDVDITEGAKEFAAQYEAEVASGLIFYLALGSISGGPDFLSSIPYTILPHSTLPPCTVSSTSESDSMRVKGAELDRLRVSWSAGEYVTYEAEFIGTGTIAMAAIAETCQWGVTSAVGASVEVLIGTDTLTESQGGYFEINNNLQARYTCGKGNDPQTIREQRLEVSGALTVGQADIGYFTPGGKSLQVRIKDFNTGSIMIYIGSVWFDELPDEFVGHDVYEIEFTWTAMPITGGNIIEIIDSTSIKVW